MIERLRSLWVPFGIVLVSLYGCLYVQNLPVLWLQLLAFLPIVFAVMAALLAWHFNKGRALIAMLLILMPVVLSNLTQQALLSGYWLAACFSLAMMTLVPERGFFNRFALNRLLLIALLMACCYAIDQQWLSLGFLQRIVIFNGIHLLTLIYWLIYSFSFAVVALAWWRHGDAFRACCLLSLTVLLVIALVPVSALQFTVLLSAALFIWICFSLQESHRMAYVDDLTALPGRRALNEKLVSLPKDYALAMIDVDHFKKFNDSYGHDMGDKVLRQVAQRIQRTPRGRGYRFGGEEFTLVFAGKRLDDVEALLDVLREDIASMDISIIEPKTQQVTEINVTVSIGVAFAASGDKAQAVLKRADEALYQSKRKGRNRVSCAPLSS